MKILHLLLVLHVSCSAWSQPEAETAIRKLMAAQEVAWNSGDIPGFMEGYWKNDSLLFVGKNGPTYGWQQTLDHYKKGYLFPGDKINTGNVLFYLWFIISLVLLMWYIIKIWKRAPVYDAKEDVWKTRGKT